MKEQVVMGGVGVSKVACLASSFVLFAALMCTEVRAADACAPHELPQRFVVSCTLVTDADRRYFASVLDRLNGGETVCLVRCDNGRKYNPMELGGKPDYERYLILVSDDSGSLENVFYGYSKSKGINDLFDKHAFKGGFCVAQIKCQPASYVTGGFVISELSLDDVHRVFAMDYEMTKLALKKAKRADEKEEVALARDRQLLERQSLQNKDYEDRIASDARRRKENDLTRKKYNETMRTELEGRQNRARRGEEKDEHNFRRSTRRPGQTTL